MAIKANLVIDQGVDYSTSITLTDDDGAVVNLASYSVASQMRKTYTSSNAVTFGISLTAATEGIVVLTLTANQTANIAAGRYVYDVVTTDPANVTSRIVEGIVTVTPRVTR